MLIAGSGDFLCTNWLFDIFFPTKENSVVIRKPKRKVHKASHCGSKQQERSCAMITLLLLVYTTWMSAILRTHPVHGESHIQHNAQQEVATIVAKS